MKKFISAPLLGLLALLCSAQGNAFTVTAVPSTASPIAGSSFTITLVADVGNTLAATMQVFYDSTKVAWVSGAMPAAGPFAPGAGGSYTKNTAYTSGSVFDISTNTATAAFPAAYDAVVLTFNALVAGAANIIINDDGGGCCLWADATTADYIPVTYNQTSVTVQPLSGVPVPAAVWLFASALGSIAGIKRLRRQ